MRAVARTALWCLGIVFVAYVALLLVMYWRQESLLFQPSALPRDHEYKVKGLEDVFIPVEGAVIAARHLKLPNSAGVVFFLHGNGGNNDGWVPSVDLYRRVNLDLFIIDYRGYGKSTGRIESEAQLHADVRRAWDQVAPQYADRRKIIFGRSLGTGLAAKLAAEVAPDKVVLVSPYKSMVAMVREIYPFVPAFLLRYPLLTDRHITQIRAPITIFHGENDELIPPAHALHLQTLAKGTRVVLIPRGRHNDLQEIPAYIEELAKTLKDSAKL
jgi:uncharacterized protein